MNLQELRQKIDGIDGQLICLFQQRMDISAEIARYKRRYGIPVCDPEREKQKLCDLSRKVKDDHAAYVSALFSLLFEISRAEQEKILGTGEAF